jgi:glutamate-1-semialdehyde 2,1-aminomutase
MPGGVSSDIRLSGPALVFSRGEGACIYDVDGNRYVDYVLGMGPLVLGHNPAAVVEAVREQAGRGLIYGGQNEFEAQVAEQIAAVVPCAEQMRFSTVGSEATHAAARLARGFTGRQQILKFEGHYHGWLDSILYSTAVVPDRAGPGERPETVPMTGGMAASAAGDVVVAPWNDLQALTAIMEANRGAIAGVIMEPVMCNTGCISPLPGYLEGVQKLCRQHGTVLIFDEVITGFRMDLGGAQRALGVTPDLATFGKAVAAGLPLSVVAGRAEIMDLITQRKVMHAGTFNSNPLVMAGASSALATLAADGGAAYDQMRRAGRTLAAGMEALGRKYSVPLRAVGPGPMLQVYFSAPEEVRNARDVAASDSAARDRFIAALLDHGVRLTARGLIFLSTQHGEGEIGETLEAVEAVLAHW